MKGLLLKDYYLIGSVLWILLAAMAVIGIAMAVLTSAWALVVIATVMLGMVSVSTINMDKASGWYKVSRVMPVARQAVVDSKYLLYLLLSGVGLLLGMVLGMVASLIQGGQSGEEALLYLTISVAMALLAGSVTLPCSFLFSEEKNVLAIFLAYPAAAGIFAGVVVPLGVTPSPAAWWRGSAWCCMPPPGSWPGGRSPSETWPEDRVRPEQTNSAAPVNQGAALFSLFLERAS